MRDEGRGMRVNYRWAQVGAKAEEDAFLGSKLFLLLQSQMGDTGGVDLDDAIADLPDWVWANSFNEPV